MKAQMTDRQREVIRIYIQSPSLRNAAEKLGISMQRVHQVVREKAPELMQEAHKRSLRESA